MTTRVGLGIGRDSVRAVLVRRNRIVWSHVTAMTDEMDLREAVEVTLRALPRKRGRRRKVIAAVGPSLTQLKCLLPGPASNDYLLGAAVSANIGRFFLRNGVPLRVSGLRRDTPQRAWIAAIEEPAVVAIEEACRTVRLRYLGAVPSLAVLNYAVRGGASNHILWRDDDVTGEVTIENGRLAHATRSSSDEGAEEAPQLVEPVPALNGEGWRLADAYAGAVADPKDPLVLRPMADAVRQRRKVALRRVVLAALTVSAGLTALFAPGLLATRARAVAEARLVQLAPLQRQVSATQQALGKVNRALQRISEFGADRPRMAHLLASITESAPLMTAVLNVRVDSAGGSLLALSPHGAEVFAAISKLPSVTGARITAPLTRETLESTELERVAVRFEFLRATPKPMRSTKR